MHPLQKKIFSISLHHNLAGMTLREIGELIGESHPQIIKHHLSQLQKRGLLRSKVNIDPSDTDHNDKFISIPIIGSANCGPATIFADENIEGYLKFSPQLMKHDQRHLIALKAQGNSMNRSNINGKSINDGDYVLVNTSYKTAETGDYVLSIIDGMANVKCFIREADRIILLSESTQDLPPIFIHPDDMGEYMINGKIIDVIKKPNANLRGGD